VKLAKEFDISGVGLAKVCRASNIPLPPLGHWTKLEHGKATPQPVLPESALTTVTFDARQHRTEPPPGKRPARVKAAPEVEVEVEVKVEVKPAVSVGLAPFTMATQKKLLATEHTQASISTYDADIFECRVSRASIETLCQFLDAIERGVPRFGGELKPGQKGLDFVFDEQAVSFRITEQFTTSTLLVPGKKYASWERPEVVHNYTGKFTLEIHGYFEGRKKWADGKRQKLTEVLTECLDGLVAAAKAVKRRRIESEEQSRRWREESERRAELERRQRDRLDFQTKLLAEARATHDHVLLVEYVDRMKDELQSFVGPLPESTMQWLSTAASLAAWEGPLTLRKRLLAMGVARDYGSGSFGKLVA
jgi:hypothetical protein